jgi:alkanesulfonate monooxygenase SsuD/methylene tetrahydromethanopterin reductase-like flavin-dependent oxidoreductase (luciferase family)
VPFPPISERFERLEEALQICLQMWSDDEGPYAGKHYQLAETICVPPPVQQPRPKILIGGSGEQKTLRFVAKYADACNLFAPEPAVVQHKLEVLARHCEAEGRDYASVEKTIVAGSIGPDLFDDVDAFITSMDAYASLGITKVWVSPTGPDPAGWVTRYTEEILPTIRDL